MKIKPTQAGFAHAGLVLFFIVVMAAIGGTGTYVYKQNKKPVSDQSQAAATASVAEEKKTLSREEFEAAVESKISELKIDNLKAAARKPDLSLIIVNKDKNLTTFSTTALEIKLSGKIPDPQTYSQVVKNIPQIAEIDEAVKALAAENGLEPDSVNTRKDLPAADVDSGEVYVINYSAYQNDDYRCVLGEPVPSYDKAVNDIATYDIIFGCVDQTTYQEQYELQVQLREAFSRTYLKEKYVPDGKGIVSISEHEGDFIHGGIGDYMGGGGTAYWKKLNGKWEYLFGGQAAPNCEDADGNGIPKDMLKNVQCFDSEKNDYRDIQG